VSNNLGRRKAVVKKVSELDFENDTEDIKILIQQGRCRLKKRRQTFVKLLC